MNIDPIEQRRLERADAAVKARAAKPVTFHEMTDRYIDERKFQAQRQLFNRDTGTLGELTRPS